MMTNSIGRPPALRGGGASPQSVNFFATTVSCAYPRCRCRVVNLSTCRRNCLLVSVSVYRASRTSDYCFVVTVQPRCVSWINISDRRASIIQALSPLSSVLAH